MAEIVDHAEFKHLTRRLDESRATLKAYKDERTNLDTKIKREQESFNRLQTDIDRMKKKAAAKGKVVISEHAILRYIERVMHIDLEEVKKKILPKALEKPFEVLGSGTFPADTHKVRVKNGVVITIVTDDE